MGKAAIAALWALLLAAPAWAGTIRFPETGLPAIQVMVPDGWEHSTDTDHNLYLYDPATPQVRLVINVQTDNPVATSHLDLVAQGALKVAKAEPPVPAGMEHRPGFDGPAYESSAVYNNVTIAIRLYLSRIDDKSLFTVTTVWAPSATPQARTAASDVIDTLTVLK